MLQANSILEFADRWFAEPIIEQGENDFHSPPVFSY